MTRPPLLDAGFQPRPQRRQALHVVGTGRQRRGERAARGRILRSPAIALLLAADRREGRKVAHQQHADAGRTAELVRAGGDEVGIGQRQLARALRAIGQQQRARRANCRGNPVERLDDAGLVVDLLDRD